MFTSLSELFFPSCSRTSQFLHYLPSFTGKTAIFLRNWEIWFWNEIKQLLVETNLIFLQFMTLFFRAVSVYLQGKSSLLLFQMIDTLSHRCPKSMISQSFVMRLFFKKGKEIKQRVNHDFLTSSGGPKQDGKPHSASS